MAKAQESKKIPHIVERYLLVRSVRKCWIEMWTVATNPSEHRVGEFPLRPGADTMDCQRKYLGLETFQKEIAKQARRRDLYRGSVGRRGN